MNRIVQTLCIIGPILVSSFCRKNPRRQSLRCSAGRQTEPLKEPFVLRAQTSSEEIVGGQTDSGHPVSLDTHAYTQWNCMSQHFPFKQPYFILWQPLPSTPTLFSTPPPPKHYSATHNCFSFPQGRLTKASKWRLNKCISAQGKGNTHTHTPLVKVHYTVRWWICK